MEDWLSLWSTVKKISLSYYNGCSLKVSGSTLPGHWFWTTSIIGFVIIPVMCVLIFIFFFFLFFLYITFPVNVVEQSAIQNSFQCKKTADTKLLMFQRIHSSESAPQLSIMEFKSFSKLAFKVCRCSSHSYLQIFINNDY